MKKCVCGKVDLVTSLEEKIKKLLLEIDSRDKANISIKFDYAGREFAIENNYAVGYTEINKYYICTLDRDLGVYFENLYTCIAYINKKIKS